MQNCGVRETKVPEGLGRRRHAGTADDVPPVSMAGVTEKAACTNRPATRTNPPASVFREGEGAVTRVSSLCCENYLLDV